MAGTAETAPYSFPCNQSRADLTACDRSYHTEPHKATGIRRVSTFNICPLILLVHLGVNSTDFSIQNSNIRVHGLNLNIYVCSKNYCSVSTLNNSYVLKAFKDRKRTVHLNINKSHSLSFGPTPEKSGFTVPSPTPFHPSFQWC